jgi:FtsP/CotA-like multicopper oxidase with cupredoxin domain
VVGWLWNASRLPAAYSVMQMGHAVGGGGTLAAGHAGPGAGSVGRSVTSLGVAPGRPADATFTLVARRAAYDLPGGRRVEGYTVNGTSPGPELRVRQGQLVQVTLVNESVTDGATLHWHGVDVPNAVDGVAGVTQDAVPVGGSHVYRFVAEDAGTYWYHSHQLSHEQVERGLFGALVVEPAVAVPDVVVLLHVYSGQHTLNGRVADEHVVAGPGSRVRLRVINTDQGTAAVWSNAAYRVMAVDAREVNEPLDVEGRKVLVPAGGRADVEVRTPPDGAGVRVHVGGARSVVVGPAGAAAPAARQPAATLDLLAYGAPRAVPFDPSRADRTFEYVIGRRLGLVDGRPGSYWTVNGRLFPDVPMFHVREGDVVRMSITNRSGEVHPMHLHGHHAVVLARDGVAATGSPWWVDSLDVHPGETYEIAFLADNPGIWMDHCHTLAHAVDGLVAHVMYEGVTTPFLVKGPARNHPE